MAVVHAAALRVTPTWSERLLLALADRITTRVSARAASRQQRGLRGYERASRHARTRDQRAAHRSAAHLLGVR